MTKHVLWTAVVLVGLVAAPARAELRYTMRIESHASTVPAAAPANPLMGIIGSVVVGAIAPAGGLEMTITVGEQGTRVDYGQAYMMIPAGGSTILRSDGSMVVIDSAARTFWKIAKPDQSAFVGTTGPTVTMKQTGEFSTIAGARAERGIFEIRMPLPAPPGAQLPPGIPTDLQISGEIWLAPQYAKYARLTAGLFGGVNAFGLDKLAAGGFMMRSILRGEILGEQEIEVIVTSVAEGPVPASTFEIPDGFAEVPPPSSLTGMPGRQ